MRKALVAAVLLAASLTLPAAAQDDDEQRANAEVARSGDAVLLVGDGEREDELCMRLEIARRGSSGCNDTTRVPEVADLLDFSSNVTEGWSAGAVHFTVTRVELELQDGRRVTVATTAGEAYEGRFAGRLRFFLARTPQPLALVRLYDASGMMVGAAGARFHETPILRRHRLLRAEGVTVTAQQRSVHAATPLQLDRRARQICIAIQEPNGSGGSSCFDEGVPLPGLILETSNACAPRKPVLHGVAAASTRRLRLLLGSGRTITLPVRRLPAEFGVDLGIVAAVLPRLEAVRSARTIDDSGRVGKPEKLGLAPGGLPCPKQNQSGSTGSIGVALAGETRPSQEGAVAAVTLGEHRLMVRDEGDNLCSGLDSIQSCQLPPVAPEHPFVEVRDGVAWSVFSRHVAALVLTRKDGSEVRLETTEGSGYSGPYAGRVRFLLAEVSGEFKAARVVEADGSRLGEAVLFGGEAEQEFKPRRVLNGPGWTLTAGSFTGGFSIVSSPQPVSDDLSDRVCLGLRAGGRTVDRGYGACLLGGGRAGGIGAEVMCSPRQAVLFGFLPKGVRGVRLRTSAGRWITARTRRLPASMGGDRVWAVSLPKTAGLTRVRFLGKLPRLHPRIPRPSSTKHVTLLPAARQCGYHTHGF